MVAKAPGNKLPSFSVPAYNPDLEFVLFIYMQIQRPSSEFVRLPSSFVAVIAVTASGWHYRTAKPSLPPPLPLPLPRCRSSSCCCCCCCCIETYQLYVADRTERTPGQRVVASRCHGDKSRDEHLLSIVHAPSITNTTSESIVDRRSLTGSLTAPSA